MHQTIDVEDFYVESVVKLFTEMNFKLVGQRELVNGITTLCFQSPFRMQMDCRNKQ